MRKILVVCLAAVMLLANSAFPQITYASNVSNLSGDELQYLTEEEQRYVAEVRKLADQFRDDMAYAAFCQSSPQFDSPQWWQGLIASMNTTEETAKALRYVEGPGSLYNLWSWSNALYYMVSGYSHFPAAIKKQVIDSHNIRLSKYLERYDDAPPFIYKTAIFVSMLAIKGYTELNNWNESKLNKRVAQLIEDRKKAEADTIAKNDEEGSNQGKPGLLQTIKDAIVKAGENINIDKDDSGDDTGIAQNLIENIFHNIQPEQTNKTPTTISPDLPETLKGLLQTNQCFVFMAVGGEFTKANQKSDGSFIGDIADILTNLVIVQIPTQGQFSNSNEFRGDGRGGANASAKTVCFAQVELDSAGKPVLSRLEGSLEGDNEYIYLYGNELNYLGGKEALPENINADNVDGPLYVFGAQGKEACARIVQLNITRNSPEQELIKIYCDDGQGKEGGFFYAIFGNDFILKLKSARR